MNKERVLETADLIEAGSAELGFNMACLIDKNGGPWGSDVTGRTDCGTVACIAGWICYNKFGSDASGNILDRAANYLNIDSYQAEKLFTPHHLMTSSWDNITPDIAVACLRDFAETGEVNWEKFVPEEEETENEA